MYYCNAHSICNNLISLINSNIYDILIFTETWLNKNIFNSLLNPNDKYTLYRLYRNTNTRGGGILVYVNIHYNTYQINLSNNTFELICINVLHFRLCIFYRPPLMNYENTILLYNLMSRIIDTPESTIFYGYLNLPGIDWFNGTSQTTIEKYFLNFSQKYALTQIINFNC